ncbi:hypothetical protein KY330_06105 [Candidatus Woesearchaeota archaeon]|nr:hypothetical protein [Candidatus Woesearchaeota archaeon]
MNHNFKLERLDLDPSKLNTFKEFLCFKLRQNKELGFKDFQKNCGINRKQWDLFKQENLDKEVEWIIE